MATVSWTFNVVSQSMSAARVKSFTPENVAKFFEFYELQQIRRYCDRVFNVNKSINSSSTQACQSDFDKFKTDYLADNCRKG